MSEKVHTVQDPETIEHIALKYDVNLAHLKRLNKLNSLNNPVLGPGDTVLISPKGNDSSFIDVDSDDAFDEQLIEFNFKLEEQEHMEHDDSDDDIAYSNSELLIRRNNANSLRNVNANSPSTKKHKNGFVEALTESMSAHSAPRSPLSGTGSGTPGTGTVPLTPAAIRHQLTSLNNRVTNSTKREIVLHKKLKGITDSYNNLRQEVRLLVAAVQEKNDLLLKNSMKNSEVSSRGLLWGDWLLFITVQTCFSLIVFVIYIIFHDWQRITS